MNSFLPSLPKITQALKDSWWEPCERKSHLDPNKSFAAIIYSIGLVDDADLYNSRVSDVHRKFSSFSYRLRLEPIGEIRHDGAPAKSSWMHTPW